MWVSEQVSKWLKIGWLQSECWVCEEVNEKIIKWMFNQVSEQQPSSLFY